MGIGVAWGGTGFNTAEGGGRNMSSSSHLDLGHPLHLCWPLSTHCFYRQPGEGIQIGPNRDLSKALNNRYRLSVPPTSPAPGHFGVLLIKMHLLAFVVVAIKWIIRPKTKKNLFS